MTIEVQKGLDPANVSGANPDTTGTDLTALTEQIETLNETLTEEKTVLVNEKEMTSEEVLAEILNVLEPTPEQVEQQNLLTKISTSLDNLIAINEQQHQTEKELLESQHLQNIQGDWLVALTIIISFSVYMFWSQLSKW